MKRLDLVIGPNGSGKSTFVELTLAPVLPTSVFVNADVIARHRWPEDAEAKSYEAAMSAAATRDALIDAGRSFIAETVFSHPSKLDLIAMAQANGFVVVTHVLLVPESLAVLRVSHRVASGGHSAPEAKIRSRYHRLWPLVARAVVSSAQATVYDSAAGNPQIVARFVGGSPVGAISWPSWTPAELTGLA